TLGVNGGKLEVTAANNADAKQYAVKVIIKENSQTLKIETLLDNVKALEETRLFLRGIADRTAGESIKITGASLQEQAVSTGALLTLMVAQSGGSTQTVTAVMSVGQSNVSTTLSALTSGAYTVTFTANDGTKIMTRTARFHVKEVGAPIFTMLKVAGVNALEFSDVRLVGASPTLFVDISVQATANGSTIVYALQSGASPMAASQSTPVAVTTQTVSIGTTYFGLLATANGKTNLKPFKVTYTQNKRLVVSSVVIGGTVANTSGGNLSNSVVNGKYFMDASSVQGLTLNTSSNSDTLYIDIMAGAGTTALAGPGYNFKISLSEAGSSRNATLNVVNASVTGNSANGFDVTTAASLDFSGTKNNGSSATVTVPVDTVLANFTALFSPITGGIRVDIIALRSSLEQVLAGNAFASSLRTLSGSNLLLNIRVNGANFSMGNASGASFTSFEAVNVKVN
ncbi:hypothetical protein MJH12_14905, partial [bacterium]|nr:hypothetical protein [bacterium]